MTKRRWAILTIATVLILAIMIPITMRAFAGDKVYEVTVILKSEEVSEFWGEALNGIERASADYNIQYEVVSSVDENDVLGQMRILEKVIENKPDGIILAATDYFKLETLTEQIKGAGIDLVLIDSGVRGDNYDSLVSTDNYKAGYQGAKELTDYLVDPTHIVLVNHVQSSLTAMEREQGARDALKSTYGDGITVEIYYCNDDPDAAYDYISRLDRYGVEIDGIIGLNERSTVGAARYLDDNNKGSQIPVVGFDSSIEEIELMEKGTVKTLIIQQPFNMGYLSMESLFQAMNGKQVTKTIDTGSIIITGENMYDPEHQVLLFPFRQE